MGIKVGQNFLPESTGNQPDESGVGSIYYNIIINTNEIPSELSRENMISSHVKRSLLLWLHMKIVLFGAFREMI